MPRSIPLIYLFILLTFTCGIRLQLGFVYHYTTRKKINKIGIIDTNGDSIKIANFLHRDNENKVIAFFDKKRSSTKTKISGISVYSINDLEKIISYKKINMILITSSEISSELNKALFNCIARYKVEVKKAPVLNTFTNFYSKTSLKDISIEDLLGRKPY